SKEKLYILKLNYLEAEKVAEFLNKLDVLKVIQIKADGASDVSQLQKAALSRILNVTKTEMIQEQGKENSKQPQIDSPNDKLLYSYSEKTKEKRIQRGRIIADTTTNTLIIRATPLQYKVIESLIKKLDKTPTQVFIEMVVAEVSVGDSLNYGLEALFKGFLDKYPFSIETSFGLKQNSPRLSGFKAIIFGKNADIRGILNFLASKTNLRVLSAPYVLVKNLEEAKVEIGAEVPIVSELMTSVSNGTPVITTAIQYRSTGIILKVKPIISADGTITLKIEEEVSDAIPNTLSPEVQSPIITKRSATTTLVLKSGQIALLGGILQHRFEANKKGIPVISDIPGLGYLFKSESKSTSKTELIILIRAYIIQDLSEISRFRDETINKLEDLKNLIKIIKEKGKEK
ncbi:MAG TPA: general secretion pathway protein GspD, partial [Nautiliaceae bacterium]|nr:general secretion pathway protein GspD [Nautiliaceae bacterium]